jgi:hypothetical protein
MRAVPGAADPTGCPRRRDYPEGVRGEEALPLRADGALVGAGLVPGAWAAVPVGARTGAGLGWAAASEPDAAAFAGGAGRSGEPRFVRSLWAPPSPHLGQQIWPRRRRIRPTSAMVIAKLCPHFEHVKFWRVLAIRGSTSGPPNPTQNQRTTLTMISRLRTPRSVATDLVNLITRNSRQGPGDLSIPSLSESCVPAPPRTADLAEARITAPASAHPESNPFGPRCRERHDCRTWAVGGRTFRCPCRHSRHGRPQKQD